MREAWIGSRGALVALAFGCALSVGCASGAAAQVSGGGNNSTVYSNSTSITQTITTQTLTQRTDTFVTDILGKLNGGTVFDQTFNAAFSDPTVQAGVAAARAAITTAGGPGVIIAGPTQISQTVTLLSSTPVTTSVLQSSTLAAYITTAVGPVTIAIGNLGVCSTITTTTFANGSGVLGTRPSGCSGGTSFLLAPGQTDLDIDQNTAQQILQTTTTTNAYQTLTTYELSGTVQAIGTVHTAVGEVGFDQTDRFSRRLLDAGLDDRTVVSSPPTGGALLSYAETLVPGPIDGALSRKNTAVSPSPWRSWAEGYGYIARESQSGPIPGNVRQSFGVNGGIGYDLSENFRLGAAFDFGSARIDSDTVGEHANVSLSQVALYGGWRQGPMFAALAASYGWGSASTTVAPIGFGSTAASNNNLTVASVSGETGYHLPAGTFTLTPTLGGQFSWVDLGGFTETGSPFALTGASQGYDRMKGWLGLRADTGLDFGGSRLSLAAYGRLAALGGDRAIDLPVSFVGTTTPLTVAGASTGTFGVDLGAAANYHLAPNAEIFVTYEAQLRDNFVAQTAAGGLKIAF